MARLKIKNDLSILDQIEEQAFNYKVLNIVANLGFQVFAIYASIELTTYIWRLITAPC